MANHKSAIKRARQSLRRQAINSKTLGEIRTIEKKLTKAIASKDKASSGQLLITYMSRMDKAAQKGRVHNSTASRKISRLSKRVSAI